MTTVRGNKERQWARNSTKSASRKQRTGNHEIHAIRCASRVDWLRHECAAQFASSSQFACVVGRTVRRRLCPETGHPIGSDGCSLIGLCGHWGGSRSTSAVWRNADVGGFARQDCNARSANSPSRPFSAARAVADGMAVRRVHPPSK